MTRDPASARPAQPPRIAMRRATDRPEVVLDLSRLMSRMLHGAPTGVDRVEMAYARTLLRHIPDRLAFAAVHPAGRYGRLPESAVVRFLDRTAARWERGGADETPRAVRRSALAHCWSLLPRPVPPPSGPRILLQASPHHLDRQPMVAAKLIREQARFVCLVHDLIPISHPEYARPGGAARHERRIRTIDALADGILANSRATLDAFEQRSDRGQADSALTIRIAHLGVDHPGTPLEIAAAPNEPAAADTSTPYFLCIATIEPRKNHLLLLHVWRSLVAMLGTERTPRLVLVGRRGWENENILDMLDRCPGLRGVVLEQARSSDAVLRTLLGDACALLMPSFAEGFGLPIIEALAAGVPVLASDLPAHREAGGGVPDYLDPIDGPSWRRAILDYAAPSSPRRAAQRIRLGGWRPPTWDDHIGTALALVDEVAAC